MHGIIIKLYSEMVYLEHDQLYIKMFKTFSLQMKMSKMDVMFLRPTILYASLVY